ncbi:uncharacterized protein LOC144448774 isoform X2 [Glandiceps talaboti]
MSMKEHLEAFVASVREMRERFKAGDDVFNADFQLLKQNSLKYRRQKPSRAGETDINMKKNRYKDIIPFDETRVILPEIPNTEGSDYINANFIRGVGQRNKVYLASQGPLPYTVVDFWRMLWSFKINVIVMACKLIENGKPKCERYWSESNEERTFGEITVTVKSQKQQSQNVIVRTFCAKKGAETRTLNQYHYTAWPDHGIPSSPIPIVAMVKSFREDQPHDETPIVIHCSAGCGRTGAIVVIDYVMKLLENEMLDSEFNLFDLIDEMRRQRPAIVQTRDQYEFVHYCVSELMLEELRRKYEDYSQHTYENVYLESEGKPEFTVELPAKTGAPSPAERKALSAERRKQNASSYVNVTLPDEDFPSERIITQEKPKPAARSPLTPRADHLMDKPFPTTRPKQLAKPTVKDNSQAAQPETLLLPVKQRQAVVAQDLQTRLAMNVDKNKQQTEKPQPCPNKPIKSSSDDGNYERVKPGTVSSAMAAFMKEPTQEPILPKKKTSPDDKKMRKNDQIDISHHGAVAMPTPLITQEHIRKQLMKKEERKPTDLSLKKEEEENHEYEPINVKEEADERKKDVRHKDESSDMGKDKLNIQKALTEVFAAGRQKDSDIATESSPRVAPKRNKKGKDISPTTPSPRKFSQPDLQIDGDAYAIIGGREPPKRINDYEDIDLRSPTKTSPTIKTEPEIASPEGTEYAVVVPRVVKHSTPPKLTLQNRSHSLDSGNVAPALPERTDASFQMIDEDDTSEGKDTTSVSSFGSSDSLEQRSEQGSNTGGGFKMPKFLRRGGAKKKSEEAEKPTPYGRKSLPNVGLPSSVVQDLEESIRQAKEQHSPTFVQGPTVHHKQNISFPNRPFKTNGPREPPKKWQQQPSANAEPIHN